MAKGKVSNTGPYRREPPATGESPWSQPTEAAELQERQSQERTSCSPTGQGHRIRPHWTHSSQWSQSLPETQLCLPAKSPWQPLCASAFPCATGNALMPMLKTHPWGFSAAPDTDRVFTPHRALVQHGTQTECSHPTGL